MRFRRFVVSGLAWIGLALLPCVMPAQAQHHPAAAATDPLSKVNPLPAELEQTVRTFRTKAEGAGFAVARGYWTLWGIEDCKYPIQTVGYCYGNNPTAPYVVAVVPQWRDEYRDPSFHHLLNEPLRNMTSIYRLDPREALVIVAEMPPEARYFGLGTNVFTREIAFNPDDRIYQTVSTDPVFKDPLLLGILFGASPDPARRMLVASIGNSTNNVVMKNQMGASPWGKPAYFVVTSDAGLAEEMKAELIAAGADSDAIFTEPVSPALVNLGLGRSADDFVTYIRYSLPDDPAAGEQWRETLPLTVLRVRDASTRAYNQAFAIPVYTPRSYHFDETALADDFTALQGAMRTKWAQPSATMVPFFSAYKFLDLVGQHCLGNPDPKRGPMDCLGDTQDADYQISGSVQIDNGQVIAVLGTLSTETGNATYTSLSVNWFPELVGVKNIDDVQLKGSAASFASALANSPDLFYVYYIARDCTGLTNCVEVSTKLVPRGGTIKFIQRNYVNPGSTNGPNPNEILNPVAIVLDGTHRPEM